MSKTIKQLFVVVCLFAGSAFAQCTDPGTSYAITGNFSVELYGPVDTRPGTYGHADYWVWQQPFTNVPARLSGADHPHLGRPNRVPQGRCSVGNRRWRSGGRVFVCWHRLDPRGLCGSGVLLLLPARDNGTRFGFRLTRTWLRDISLRTMFSTGKSRSFSTPPANTSTWRSPSRR